MKGENDIRNFFQESLLRTKNRTHARLNTQRMIISNLYGMWKRGEPYRAANKEGSKKGEKEVQHLRA